MQHIRGYVNIRKGSEKDLLNAVGMRPVAAAIDAHHRPFKLYRSGVFSLDACTTHLTHGLLVVGYGKESGKKYWKVKNSWGTSWGDNGFGKVVRDQNMCAIATATHMLVHTELVHTEATAHMRATEATEATAAPTAGTVTATHMVRVPRRVPTPDMDMDTHTAAVPTAAVPTLDFTAVPTLDSTAVRTLDTEMPTVGMAMDTHTLVVPTLVPMVDTVAFMDTHTRHRQQTQLHLDKPESMNIIFTVCYLYDCDSEVHTRRAITAVA